MIAVALYLALRPAGPPSPGARPPADRPPPAAPPPDAALRPDATLRPDAALRPMSTIATEVAAALEAQRARFVKDCWQPALAARPTPPTSRYRFNITVDPGGKEIARGISELREVPSRPDVAQCLRGIVDAAVQIAPPGRSVGVEVTFDLP